jgi:hypothetical protein
VSEALTQMALLLRRRSTGAPLAEPARARVESQAGRPLGSVRVHDDGAAGAAARLLGARAFTIGQDVYLGADAPRSGPAADRVLDHELAHTLQQRTWTGGPLGFDHGAGRHEPEAERVSTGAPSVLGEPGPPAVMALHPAVWALIIGELACLFGFYFYALKNLWHKGDKYLHCWTSCKIATWCPPVPLVSQAIAALVGALKELLDIVIGEAEIRDMQNNAAGIECSLHYLTSCDECCEAKLTAGQLAEAPSGPGERESEVTGAEATALARDEAGTTPTEGAAASAATATVPTSGSQQEGVA